MFLLHTQKPHQMSSFTIGFDILKFIEMSIKFQLIKLQYVQEFSVQHSFTKNIKFHLCLWQGILANFNNCSLLPLLLQLAITTTCFPHANANATVS